MDKNSSFGSGGKLFVEKNGADREIRIKRINVAYGYF